MPTTGTTRRIAFGLLDVNACKLRPVYAPKGLIIQGVFMRSLSMRWLWLMSSLMFLLAPSAGAARAVFEPRELFRIPFGTQREALGTAVEDGQFRFPRDFSMDPSGRFYIYDQKKHRIARYSAAGNFE